MEKRNAANMAEQDRTLMEDHMRTLREISEIYLHVLTGEQNSLKRFLYCCVEKLSKLTQSLQTLYPLVYGQPDLELSVGILLRSLLMDSILTQYLRYFTLEVTEENYDETITKLHEESLVLIADGTANIIQDFFATDKLDDSQKRELAHRIASFFPGLFLNEDKAVMPKLKKEYRVSLAKFHEKGKHDNQHSYQNVYELYAFYSKYDHVSH